MLAGRSRFWISAQPRPIFDARRRNNAPRSSISAVSPIALFPLARRGAGEEQAMAGHSQFKNSMHRKGRQDAAISTLFGKRERDITFSARRGWPASRTDP